MDADLTQWMGCSKLCSGQMEALVRLHGDAVEVGDLFHILWTVNIDIIEFITNFNFVK